METTNDNLIDKQLYISMQQGNKKAFDTLFIKYYAMLCAFARSFVSLEDAEEVVCISNSFPNPSEPLKGIVCFLMRQSGNNFRNMSLQRF